MTSKDEIVVGWCEPCRTDGVEIRYCARCEFMHCADCREAEGLPAWQTQGANK